jgi:hypothetical protein
MISTLESTNKLSCPYNCDKSSCWPNAYIIFYFVWINCRMVIDVFVDSCRTLTNPQVSLNATQNARVRENQTEVSRNPIRWGPPQWGTAVMKLRAPPVWNHRSSLWFLFSVMLTLCFFWFFNFLSSGPLKLYFYLNIVKATYVCTVHGVSNIGHSS